jgi:hypothetical protein
VPTKTLSELLRQLADLGELSRLLSVFASRKITKCPLKELISLVNQTAGVGVRLPKPEDAIEVALYLGLLNKRASLFEVTSLGDTFLKYTPENITKLSPGQASLLLGLFVDDPHLNDYLRELFSLFQRQKDGFLKLQASLTAADRALSQTTNLLHQLGVLIYEAGTFTFNDDFRNAISFDITMSLSINEEDLWKRLDEQRRRAQEIEKLVLKEEKKRLIREGRVDLVEAVIRVSAVEPGRGYDIASFNVDGSPRCIEVKSSQGNQVRFEWSVGERMQAAHLRENYWIYLVPLSHMLPENYCPVLMIRNPISLVESGQLIETPTGFLVLSATKSSITRSFSFSQDSSMISWTIVAARSRSLATRP